MAGEGATHIVDSPFFMNRFKHLALLVRPLCLCQRRNTWL